jgi:hypothetical protein
MRKLQTVFLRLYKSPIEKFHLAGMPQPYHIPMAGGDGSLCYIVAAPSEKADALIAKAKTLGELATKQNPIECARMDPDSKLSCFYNLETLTFDCKIV